MLRSSCLMLLLFVGACFAQTAESAKFYKLNFVVKELEGGRVVKARDFSTMISTEKSSTPSSIRAGSKVPYTTSTAAGGAQMSYADVGVNIDCRAAVDLGTALSLVVSAEISSTARDPSLPPVIRQNKWGSIALLPIRKPVVIFSSDDASGKGQMQLELTAIPVN